MNEKQAVGRFIDEHVARVQPLYKRRMEAYWNLATTGKKEFEGLSARLEAEYRGIYAEAEAFGRVRRWHEQRDGLGDPSVSRQVELLYLSYLGNQMDLEMLEEMVTLQSEAEGIYNNFRGQFEGKSVTDNEISQVLKEEDDSRRRKEAWEAGKQVGGQVVGRVLRLVDLRNGVARNLGFRDHYGFSLYLDEIDEGRLFQILERLAELTEGPFRAAKAELDAQLSRRFGVAVRDLRPWHYADPFFQEAPQTGELKLDPLFAGRDIESLTVSTYRGLDLAVEDILAGSDLYAREGKSQHAFCIHVDRGEDVRVLCNIVANERWMGTMLHEFGHAVYDKYLAAALPFLLRAPAHSLTTEAVAMLMGRLTRVEAWMRQVLGISPSDLGPLSDRLRAHQRLAMLIFVRWVLVMTHFERALYADPSRDLSSLWWDLVERFQLVPRPEGRRGPDWAAKIHLALVPVYYQNYILGELMASQLLEHLETHVTPKVAWFTCPDSGRFLVDRLFRAGASQHWEATLKQTTGAPLAPDCFVRQFLGES